MSESFGMEIGKALLPLASTIFGAITRLVTGATDEESRELLREVATQIGATEKRIDDVRREFAGRDAANDARGLV